MFMRCSTFVETPDRVAANVSPVTPRMARSMNPAVFALRPRGFAKRFSPLSRCDDLRTSQSKSLTMKKLSAMVFSEKIHRRRYQEITTLDAFGHGATGRYAG